MSSLETAQSGVAAAGENAKTEDVAHEIAIASAYETTKSRIAKSPSPTKSPTKSASRSPMESVSKKARMENHESEPPIGFCEDVEPDEEACQDIRYPDAMKLNPDDGTLNVLISETGLVSGIHSESLPLVGSVRSNYGLVAGRYLFETEIMTLEPQGEVRLGFSVAASSVFMGEKGSLCVSSSGDVIIDGIISRQPGFAPPQIERGDVVGLFLNRTQDVGNANSLSVFINGTRVGDPHIIPDSFKGAALFPHVSVRAAIVAVNFSKTLLKDYPFRCRLVGDASQQDVVASDIKEVEESELVLLVGAISREWIRNYVSKRPEDHLVEISEDYVNEWQEKSGMKAPGKLSDDALGVIHRLMGLRRRRFIYALEHYLRSEDRKALCRNFPPHVTKVVFVDDVAIEALSNLSPFYQDVSLPSEDEGWSCVNFTTSKEISQEVLTKWQKRCKLNTTMEENFKASDYVKVRIEEYEKYRAASKKNAIKQKKEKESLKNGEEVKEEPKKEEEKKEEGTLGASTVDLSEFTEEDWMLADLRVELHAVCHAFRADVVDKERTECSLEFLPFYYLQYGTPRSKHFAPAQFGARTTKEVIDLIKDTIEERDGMAVPKLNVDAPFDDILKLTEDARQERVDRIGAGDEGAVLKFKAVKNDPVARGQFQNKGGYDRPLGKGPGVAGSKGGYPQGGPLQSKGASAGFNKGAGLGNKGGFVGPKGPNSGGYSMRSIYSAGGFIRPQAGGAMYQSAQKRFR